MQWTELEPNQVLSLLFSFERPEPLICRGFVFFDNQ
jgi:hypothetical protein